LLSIKTTGTPIVPAKNPPSATTTISREAIAYRRWRKRLMSLRLNG
jgi:hypothetical protein